MWTFFGGCVSVCFVNWKGFLFLGGGGGGGGGGTVPLLCVCMCMCMYVCRYVQPQPPLQQRLAFFRRNQSTKLLQCKVLFCEKKKRKQNLSNQCNSLCVHHIAQSNSLSHNEAKGNSKTKTPTTPFLCWVPKMTEKRE